MNLPDGTSIDLTETVRNGNDDREAKDTSLTLCPRTMSGVWLHPREDDRLESLRSYDLTRSPRSLRLDDLARLAAAVCGTPAAMVNLVERDHQWSTGLHGMNGETFRSPRVDSICSDAVATESNIILENLSIHDRYASNALVMGAPHIRAYAGVPIFGRDGLPLGALCVVDWDQRAFSDVQIEYLEILAEQVASRLELHRVDHDSGRSGEQVLGDALDARRLRHGIEQGEFALQFQPIVDMRTEEVVAVEALVRWMHPELGMVPPALFLPAMENTGLMIPLGRHVLASGLDVALELRRLRRIGPPPTVNINISTTELRSSGLAFSIDSMLAMRGLTPDALCIEVTETSALPGVHSVRELEAVRSRGVDVALDDFGSGTATLGQIASLPVTQIKIDRDLLRGAEKSERGRQILRSASSLARDLGLDYCVEGVETTAQRDLLLEDGVIYGQGWLFSIPLDAPQLLAYVAKNGTTLRTKSVWAEP